MNKVISVVLMAVVVLAGLTLVLAEQAQSGQDNDSGSGNSANIDSETRMQNIINQELKIAEESRYDNNKLGQTIRNRVHAGIYISESGESVLVREMNMGRTSFEVGNVEAETDLEVETEHQGNNKMKFKAKLSDGSEEEIKIMPNTASERALERLRLKVCSEENNCTLELKEVGKIDAEKKLAYEMQIERHSRILGIFQAKMHVKAEVDAGSGEIIKVSKPWWAFISTEPAE